MTLATNTALTSRIQTFASAAGLEVVAVEPSQGFTGLPTVRFTLARTGVPDKTLFLELSEDFDAERPQFAEGLKLFLAETAQRLRNPRPDTFLTINGLPLSYSNFGWPFHESTAGADTSVVHGEIRLEDGTGSPLYTRIAAAMTLTMRETVPAPEQPFAEAFILNAIRKTFDQGQLELVKSGNRQPVPVTTRYFSARTGKFNFNDSTDEQRRHFLAAKAFWFSGVTGSNEPVWIADPRDAQYLNTTPDELKSAAAALAREDLLTLATDPEFAAPTPALMARSEAFHAQLAEALRFIKPTFNEQMRGGHTNM